MKSIVKSLLVAVAALTAYGDALACTAAVVAAKASKEGATILWKNRESDYYRTSIRHLKSEKYSYTGVVRTNDPDAGVLCGVNEVGFGIVNTATRNLPTSDKPGTGSRTPFMRDALIHCRTVDEFEEYVRGYERGAKFTTNVGVGDATGAAAFFEIWGDGYRRYDVHTQERGYDVRTNFSFAGDDSKRGASERRYNTVMKQLEGRKNITTLDMLNLSRSFFSAAKGEILEDDKTHLDQNWCVPRRASVGSMVLVCDKENPRMDIILGNPVAGIAVPVWVKNGHRIPRCIAGPESMELGKRYTQKAYVRKNKRGWALNKPLIREVLAAQTRVKIPTRPPKNITRFNAKIDETFDRHRAKIDKILLKY